MDYGRLKELIKGIFMANPGRIFTTRMIHKWVYEKVVTYEQVREYLGESLESFMEKVVKRDKYGPTVQGVYPALRELVESGFLQRVEKAFYDRNGHAKQGVFYSLRENVNVSSLDLPFALPLLTIPSFVTANKLVLKAKEDFINKSLGRTYIWKSAFNMTLAYHLLRELNYDHRLLKVNEVSEIINILYDYDQKFKLSHSLSYRKWRNAETIILPIDSFVNMLIQALKIKSFSGEEAEVAEAIKAWIDDWVRVYDLKSSIKTEVDPDGNLIVALAGQHEEKILFIFHLDTVKSFLEPKIDGGYIYGRGVVDDKCPGLAAIYALLLLAINGIVPSPSVVVLGVTCEEEADPSKRGIVKAIRRYGLSRENTPLAIILEATNFDIAVGQRPRWTAEVDVFGPGMHVAHVCQDPSGWLASASNQKSERFPDLRALVRYAENKIEKIPQMLPNEGYGKLGRTTIVMSSKFELTSENQTPSWGVLHFDVRPGDEKYLGEIERQILNILKEVFINPFGFVWKGGKCTGISDFLESPVGKDIINFLEEFRPFFQVLDSKQYIYEFGVDGRYTVEADIPTIGLAPGKELFAHRSFNYNVSNVETSDFIEQLRLVDLFKAVIVYFKLLQICELGKNYDGLPVIKLARGVQGDRRKAAKKNVNKLYRY